MIKQDTASDPVEEFLASTPMPGLGSVPLGTIASEYKQQLALFASFDPVETAATFSGLLTVPDLQSNCVRLETLSHLAVGFCQGRKKPRSSDIARWFRELGEGTAGRLEDPAEDVFVSNIATPRGNFRILEGIWEASGFYLQRFVNVIEGMPQGGGYARIRECVYALLKLSDLVCERSGLIRNQLGNENPRETLPAEIANGLSALRRRVRFSPSDLRENGIRLENLRKFIFDFSGRANVAAELIGHSTLERYPIIARDGELVLALPTAPSATIRRFVIERMIAAGMREALAAGLGREYQNLFARTPLLGGKRGAPVEFERTKNGRVAAIMTRADVGRYVNYVFFGETLAGFENDGLVGWQPELAGLADSIDRTIDDAYCEARKDPNFTSGLTLLVGCGVGRGVVDFLNDKPRVDWRIELLSAPDLHTLSWLQDFKALSLWRLLDAEEMVEAAGIGLLNINGLLNMVAWRRALDGHLVPHESLPDDFANDDASLGIFIEQNSIRNLRHEVSTFWDTHVVQDAQGRWVNVRKDAESVFEEDRFRPIYGGEEAIGSGPPGIFLTETRPWWGTVRMPEGVSGDLGFRRWRMLTTWIARGAPVFEKALANLPEGPLLLSARFEGAANEFEGGDPGSVGLAEARADIRVDVDSATRTVTLVTGRQFEAANFNVENVAERAFVEAAVDGFAQLGQQTLSEAERASIVSAIVPSPAARETHVFRGRQFRDYVRESFPKSPLLIDGADVAALRFGIGWRVRKKEDGGDIRGKADCTTFLNDVVRLLEDDLCAELRQYDRAATIEFALKNHEAAASERDQWHRTASAVLALRDDSEATRAAIARHEFQLNGVFQASRLVIEFAVCDCALGRGRKPGRLDFSRFMAKVAFIQHLGGWSDAIAWDVMEPRIKISPLGDVFVNPEFIDNVMAPYGRAGSDVRVDEAVKNYARNLGQEEDEPRPKVDLDNAFLEAWEEEFGASFDETRQFIDVVEELGIRKNRGVFAVRRSELLRTEVDGRPVAGKAVSSLVDILSLKTRPAWRAVPGGYEERDIHTWRFRRRLTTLRRPLVQIDNDPDPSIIIAPGLVREAFGYMFGNYYRGDYPAWQLKPRMLSWGGAYRNKVGREFSNEVAARLRELGWKCAPCEIAITALLRKGFDKNYGDVDVLAWRPESGRVLIIECKDVQYRKTVGEIAEQLSDFRGEIGRDGKPDLLLKHLNRVDLISRHLGELAAYVGIAETPQLESHLVFKNPVPMQFALKRMEARVRLHTYAMLKNI